MSASNYEEEQILKDRFGITSWTPPSTNYMAVSTADPTDDCSGLEEPIGNSYARVSITNDGTEWSYSSGQVDNDNPITFPQATGSWGTISHWVMFDQDRTSYSVDGVDTTNDIFTLPDAAGDVTGEFAAGTKVRVNGSTGNDGIYTVASSSYDGTDTQVTVQEDVTDATADGTLYAMGNMLEYAPLDTAKSIGTDDTLEIPAGGAVIPLD
jgi:hypothetical protein